MVGDSLVEELMVAEKIRWASSSPARASSAVEPTKSVSWSVTNAALARQVAPHDGGRDQLKVRTRPNRPDLG